MVYVIIGLLAFGAALFLLLGLSADARATPSGRLRELGQAPAFGTPLHAKPTDAPFVDRVLRPVLQSVAGVADAVGLAGDARLVQLKLEVAGYPRLFGVVLGVREYLALKLICYVLAALAFLGLWSHPIMPGAMGTLVAGLTALVIAMLPTFVVDRRADARKHEILKGMSDTLDLLVVSAEAGLSLDAAMGRVAQKRGGPLADEFDVALQEMRLGKSRADALRSMARRCGVLEVRMFTNAIIQAENLGVSIAQVLRTQAETHRERRAQRLREAAAKLPVKMLFPIVLFILPALFVVTMGPAMMSLSRALGGH
ncbi:MAG TPA: type II secretion system F family protein [Armatimonadota bacterium]|jgi:tight adherence protein C